MPRPVAPQRVPRPRLAWLLPLVLLSALAGCQLGPAAPTATPLAPSAAPSAAASATATTTPASPTAGVPATPPASATRPGTVTRPTGTTAPATATRATPGTPGAASPVAGAVCAFEPPLGRDYTPPAAPVSTPTPARPPALGVPAAPAQVPPTVPLPNLAARYALTVDEFDFDAGRLHAAQTVRVTNREACALDRLYFSVTAARWGWFTLGGVTVDGQPTPAAVDGTVLPVRLPRPLAAGATTEIGFNFRLAVGAAVDPFTGNGFAGTTKSGDILRLAYWFPILSDDHQYPPFLDPPYTASADFTVTLTTPAGIVVAPTGLIDDERANPDGTITRRIEAANVRDFVMALSPNYQVARRTAANGVLVEVYYSPQSFGPSAGQPGYIEGRVGQVLEAATRAEERLSALIGPYPYPALRVVDAGALGGGIEFPALVMVGLTVSSDNLIYHEVGHEWLYGLLGTRTQQDPWIDEGGATFLADYLGGTLLANPPPAATFAYPLDSPVWAVPPVGFQRNATLAIYNQGGAFYTRVMRQMGEEAFWSAMQGLFREKRYGIITPRDLLTAWQAASPTDLRPLFGQYLTYPWIGELAK